MLVLPPVQRCGGRKISSIILFTKKHRDEITVSDLIKSNHNLEKVVNGPKDR